MAGSLISNFMMFLPQQTQWFCIIGLAVFVFGIYIPYEEHKKKKKQQQKNSPQKKEQVRHTRPAADQTKLEQLRALRQAGLLSEEEYQEKKREL